MENFQVQLQKVASKVQNNKYVSAITNGLMTGMPVLIIGAIGTMLNGLPIDAYQNFLVETGLKEFTAIPTEITTNLLALYMAFNVAVKFAESYDIDGTPAGMLSFMSFLIVTPYSFDTEALTYAITDLPSTWLGATGLFTAFIVALVTARIYVLFKKNDWVIKMPDGVPPTVSKSFSGMIPGFVIAILWLVVRYLTSLTPMGNIHSIIYDLIAAPLTALGGNVWAMIIAITVGHLLWIVGVHGMLIIMSVMTPILTVLTNENLAAYNAGQSVPNIISSPLLMMVIFAGSGTTIGLAILMTRAKSEQYNVLGKLAIIPNMVGINEPLIFGLPVVMNFTLAIPFILTPTLVLILGYLGMATGLLPLLAGFAAPLGTPIVISGFLMGGWRWAIFQVLMIGLSTAIYYPFFRAMDQKAYEKELKEKENVAVEASEDVEMV